MVCCLTALPDRIKAFGEPMLTMLTNHLQGQLGMDLKASAKAIIYIMSLKLHSWKFLPHLPGDNQRTLCYAIMQNDVRFRLFVRYHQ